MEIRDLPNFVSADPKLEVNLRAEEDLPLPHRATGTVAWKHAWSPEARFKGGQSRIVKKRINAGVIRVVESVEHRRAELNGGTLVDFERFDYPDVRNIRFGVLKNIPSRVAEGRAEYFLRFSSIYDSPHAFRRRHRCGGSTR